MVAKNNSVGKSADAISDHCINIKYLHVSRDEVKK
jgi:hypothetical protein